MFRRLRQQLLVALAISTGHLLANSLPPDEELGLPLIDVFEPGTYQGHVQVWSTVEDRAGLLYFGNFHKVLVFDGSGWSRIPVEDAVYVRGLAVDRDDTLWIGGVDELGYAAPSQTGLRTFVSLKAGLPQEARSFGEIWRVLSTPHGPLFQSAKWLLRWDGSRFATLRLPESPRWRVTDVNGETWVTDVTHGWFRVRDVGVELSLERIEPPPGCDGDRLAAAFSGADEHEQLLVTVNHGIWRRHAGGYTSFPTAVDDELRSRGVYHAARLPDGRMALTSLQAGVWLLEADGRLRAHITESNGLLDNAAIHAFAARSSASLWLSLARGLVRVDTRDWLSWFHSANGAPRGKLFAPVRMDGGLFVPASAGGLLRLEPATPARSAYLTRMPEAGNFFNTFAPAGQGMVGGGPTGFFTWSPGSGPQPLPGTPTNGFNFIPLQNQPGDWIALGNGELHRYQLDPDSGWRHRGRVHGLANVRAFIEDTDGSWWTGGPVGGVSHVTFSGAPDAAPVIETFSAGHGLPQGHDWTRLTRDGKGVLLACFPGLFRFDADARSFKPTAEFGPALADGSTTVHTMHTDGKGGLWMIITPNQGRHVAARNNPAFGRDGRLNIINLPRIRSVEDPGNLLHENRKDGRPEALWIAAQGALFRLNLDRWRATPPEEIPQVSLLSARTREGTLLTIGGGWTLPFATRSLQVHFAAPGLAGDPGAQFETTLTTSDDTLLTRNDSPRREITFVSPGDYRLVARVCASDGRWSDPHALAFTVLPPWWRSGWTITGYGLAGLGVFLAAVRLRTRALRQRTRVLEKNVAQRTVELARQNAELTRLYHLESEEKIAARLAAERARLEVLRYQLNPHFLFNTLTAICAQIIQQPAVARETVVRLAEFCRQTLHRPRSEDGTTLGEEIRMLTSYLDIEKTRLGHLLEVEIKSDPALESIIMPQFLLLPLVENAVKYGAATSPRGVRIRLTASGAPAGPVIIEVANTGEWIEPEAVHPVPSTSIGLANLRQRLERHFPGVHDFTTRAADGWVIARLRLTPVPPHGYPHADH